MQLIKQMNFYTQINGGKNIRAVILLF